MDETNPPTQNTPPAGNDNQDSVSSNVGRIEVDRELCIGATTCVAVSPDVFEMDDENKAVVKNLRGDTDENILEAARACPVAAIFIYDKQGKQMYP